jgi:hypothetical protein
LKNIFATKSKRVFRVFSEKSGNEHIASENALGGIERLIRRYRVKSVFEFGTGIGTVPYLIKSIDPKIRYVGTEPNEFCYEEASKNLDGMLGQEDEIIRDVSSFRPGQEFDLVIVDGDFKHEKTLKSLVHSSSWIFVEGDRKSQRAFIESVFPSALQYHHISLERNRPWGPFPTDRFMGGYSLFRLDNGGLSAWLDWFYARVVTSLKYRIFRPILKSGFATKKK